MVDRPLNPPWTSGETRNLKILGIDPVRRSPTTLLSIVQHFKQGGGVNAVSEARWASRPTARKIRNIVDAGKLDWVVHRTLSETPLDENLSAVTPLQAHINRLLAVSHAIRELLVVPAPWEGGRWYKDLDLRVTAWRLPGLPGPHLPGYSLTAEHEALIPLLQIHMDDPAFWQRIQRANDAALDYVSELWCDCGLVCEDVYRETSLMLLTQDMEGYDGITEEFINGVMRFALMMVDDSNPALPAFHSGRSHQGHAPLFIGRVTRRVIAHAPRDLHQKLGELLVGLAARIGRERVRQLEVTHTDIQIELDNLGGRLLASDLSEQLAKSSCTSCPSNPKQEEKPPG